MENAALIQKIGDIQRFLSEYPSHPETGVSVLCSMMALDEHYTHLFDGSPLLPQTSDLIANVYKGDKNPSLIAGTVVKLRTLLSGEVSAVADRATVPQPEGGLTDEDRVKLFAAAMVSADWEGGKASSTPISDAAYLLAMLSADMETPSPGMDSAAPVYSLTLLQAAMSSIMALDIPRMERSVKAAAEQMAKEQAEREREEIAAATLVVEAREREKERERERERLEMERELAEFDAHTEADGEDVVDSITALKNQLEELGDGDGSMGADGSPADDALEGRLAAMFGSNSPSSGDLDLSPPPSTTHLGAREGEGEGDGASDADDILGRLGALGSLSAPGEDSLMGRLDALSGSMVGGGAMGTRTEGEGGGEFSDMDADELAALEAELDAFDE
ncbi:hypothetical protein KIPB_008104 [Kipferlia bialata]|uniref:Uncharacterized protein n=1 Tax=Kipferlia bialata TaxID=797122 RepID=A0A9K3GKK4_9EUKA|nr:hypothetical protein KIPB_008104 [Kipferlia bialata]|eukprot:g8104.t1